MIIAQAFTKSNPFFHSFFRKKSLLWLCGLKKLFNSNLAYFASSVALSSMLNLSAEYETPMDFLNSI